MGFVKLPSNSKKLLDEILEANNPAEMLCEKFQGISSKEDDMLRAIIRELVQYDFIKVLWADNVPYHVVINNSARTYNEQLCNYEGICDENMKQSESSKIFISHRTTDQKIADALFDFLVATGIPRGMIFCSSLPGNDVKQNIPEEVKENMKNSCLNIAILSNDYYKSAYCLNEAGILWFQDVTVIPVALPEIEPESMIGFLNSDYRIRRLDNFDDIAYIYDTACEACCANQVKTTVVTAESRKLISKYQELTENRVVIQERTDNDLLEVTTDDERIVLYYLISNQVRKVKKSTINKWLQDNEIYDVDVDNAFDLLSTIGDGCVNDDTLEFSTNLFRKYTANAAVSLFDLIPFYKAHVKLSSEKFKKVWNNNSLDEDLKLFVVYIVDEKIDTFGARWMEEQQIKSIQAWEGKNSLDSTLSSNYGKCLSMFIHNKFVFESEWTSHGNARVYSLCRSLKELLFDNADDLLEELSRVKNNHYFPLPF